MRHISSSLSGGGMWSISGAWFHITAATPVRLVCANAPQARASCYGDRRTLWTKNRFAAVRRGEREPHCRLAGVWLVLQIHQEVRHVLRVQMGPSDLFSPQTPFASSPYGSRCA